MHTETELYKDAEKIDQIERLDRMLANGEIEPTAVPEQIIAISSRFSSRFSPYRKRADICYMRALRAASETRYRRAFMQLAME